MDLFCLEFLKSIPTLWLPTHRIVESCCLIWKSGLLFLESKQLNKLRRQPHYHYTYSIIKSVLWVYFKIECMTAVKLLTEDFNVAENPFSREILLYFPWTFYVCFFEDLNDICVRSVSFYLCLRNASAHESIGYRCPFTTWLNASPFFSLCSKTCFHLLLGVDRG